MNVTLHPNALKHLSREQVLQAWGSVTKSVRRISDDDPARWLMIGFLDNGASVELIAVETVRGWLIIHAMTPVQKKFAEEIRKVERRAR